MRTFVVILFGIFLVSCATPLATFDEKIAKVNYTCVEIEANVKLSIYDVRRACWAEAMKEFPDYSVQIKAIISKIDDIEEKAKQVQDVSQDVKEYHNMYTSLFFYAQCQTKSEEAKQLLLILMNYLTGDHSYPVSMPTQNNIFSQQQLNCHTSNSGGVPQTVCY